jgi:prepilin peptidase CpaA
VAGIIAAAIAALMLVPLALAAWRDIATRLIPDRAVIAIAVLGISLRSMDGLLALVTSIAVAGGLFLLLALLCVRGMLGGGDVKLAAAVALALGPAETVSFVVLTAIAGGVLGLGYMIGARLVAPPRRLGPDAPVLRRILAAEQRRVHRRGPLPYGVAIAVGASVVLLQSQAG